MKFSGILSMSKATRIRCANVAQPEEPQASQLGIFKLGVVADVHHCNSPDIVRDPDPVSYRDVLINNPNKIQLWKAAMDSFEPNVIAQCGDFISHAFTSEDFANPNTEFNASRFAEIKTAFENVVHNHAIHVCGNHDFMSYAAGVNFKPDWINFFGVSNTYYSVDVDGVHCVVLDTANKSDGSWNSNCDLTTDYIGTPQLAWLQNDLANTNKPVLVFAHYRLGSFYSGWSPNDLASLQTILSNSGKVVCCFSGHEHLPYASRADHAIRVTDGGVDYLSLDSLGDDYYPDANFSEITINFETSTLTLVGHGNQPSYEFQFTANNFSLEY